MGVLMTKRHIRMLVAVCASVLFARIPVARAESLCLPLGLRIWVGPSFVHSEGTQWLIGLHQASRDLVSDLPIGVDFGLDYVTGRGKDDVATTTVSFDHMLSNNWRLTAGTGIAMVEGGKFGMPLTAGIGYRLHRRADLVVRWYSLPAATRARTHAAQVLLAVW